MHGQPEQSFYQLVRPLLEQFNINVHDYILKDSYGKEHSMAKPMGQAGFYPGISVEFVQKVEPDAKMDLVKNPLAQDRVVIEFNLLFNGSEPKKIDVSRQSCIKSVLLGSGLVSKIPDNVFVQYHGELYQITMTFDQIGVLSDDELAIVAVDPAQLQNEQTVQSVQNAEQLDAAEQEQHISPLEYKMMKAEQQQWQLEMGHGQFLTQSE